MDVRVIGGVKDLQHDLERITDRAPKDMVGVLRGNLRAGNRIAKALAKKRSGSHGKYYPAAFSAEMNGIASALSGAGLYSGEFGPDSSMPQGDMSFERGSRNQPAHHELADAADVTVPRFVDDVARLPDGWFW